ncbi:MAG: queuosine precursor transporter [Gammaproteobacteria bacterium]|nr:queuosine precursor transporter [Gammaproteobacteria bacterium]MCP5424287.1 queuosine precursor transporter [Gammaproteobacteria bacterium]MCP5459040.1 queuosine precursor transporter [Gammaproteobacteria bacterium]
MTASLSPPSRHSTAFVVVVTGFITTLLVANIIAVKLIDIAGWIMPAGIIIFPVSYILGDVLTEVYGYRRARQVIWLGFACNLLAVSAIALAQALPAAGFWDGQAAFERILGYTPRLLAASFLAYVLGEFANAFVLAKMKILTQGRWLWTRTIGSTLVGQLLDSLVFVTVAFAGVMPTSALLTAIVVQWLAKSAYEALATPLTYGVVHYLKRHEGIDVYDTDIDFNPLRVQG